MLNGSVQKATGGEQFAALRPLFEAVLAHFRAGEGGLADATAYLVARVGKPVAPYLLAWLAEQQVANTGGAEAPEAHEPPVLASDGPLSGDDEHLAQANHNASQAIPVDAESSVEKIAYLLAERAGFDGDPGRFWAEAEQLIARRQAVADTKENR